MDNVFLGYACDILGDTDKGLSGSEIIKYCRKFAVEYGVEIPVADADRLKTTSKTFIANKRAALQENLCAFNEEQQVMIINELCDLPRFENNEEAKKLKIKLNSRYSHDDEFTDVTTEKTIKELSDYEKPLKKYKEALEKYEKGIYERNVLDDMRLSLELLLKEILNNNKSLENQISNLGKILKANSVSTEISTLFHSVFDFYTRYNNTYVKHNDLVKQNEMELIINQTSILIQFLIKNVK